MARRRKPRRPPQQGGVAPIKFENLDGSPADDETDDEYVDPLESEAGVDPRADDPFADPDYDDDIELEDARDPGEDAEEDAEDAAPEADADEDDEEEVDPKALRAELERERARRIELEREHSLSRQEADEARKSLAESQAKKVDDDLATVRAQLRTAVEEGETDKQVELQDKLAELHALKRDLARAPAQQRKAPDAAAEPDMPVVQPQNPAAQKWVANKAWVNNRAYAQQNRDLIRVAGQVAEDRYDPNSTDYYEEVERRMKRLHPDLFPSKPVTPQKRRGQQVGRVSRDDPPQQRSASKTIVLTAHDKLNMQRFGLDPSNKDHLREYAKNKVA